MSAALLRPMQAHQNAYDVVTALARRVETHVKSKLVGMSGMVFRSQLPQVWSFKIDQEEFSFTADKTGTIQVSEGLAEHPDVLVETSYERLLVALNSGTPAESIPSTIGVRFGSTRGRRAYFYIRKNLGI